MTRTTPSPFKRIRWDAHTCALVLVFLLAAALRLYHLGSVPVELDADEMKHYNNAYSIVTTGHDVDGKLLPFFYSSFTRHPPMYAIVGYTSTRVLGKSPFGLRFPAAFLGLVSIALMYLIALELTRRRGVALVTALVMAIAPLFVHFARIAWEPATEMPFLLGGLYVLVRAFRRADEGESPVGWGSLAPAAVLLGLTCYTYMAAWFHAIVLGGALLALNAHRFRSVQSRVALAGSLALWAVIAAPAFWMLFGDPETYERTQRMTTFGHGISLQSLWTFAGNYLAQFRWSYLVTTGDSQTGTTWRYLVGFGAFYWWVVPLVILGAFVTWRYAPQAWARRWIYVWFLAYPLGGALTTDGVPNPPRTLALATVFCLLAAIGFCALLDAARAIGAPQWRRVATIGASALLIANAVVSTGLFADYYFTRYVHVYPNVWYSGSAATFGYVRSHRQGYTRVCFSLDPAWYDLGTYVRYYLSGAPLAEFDGVTQPPCFQRGTMLVVDTHAPFARAGFTRLATFRDVDGFAFSVILGRPLPHERLPEPASP